MATAKELGEGNKRKAKVPVSGVFATHDPRVDPSVWVRGQNSVKMAADVIAKGVKLPGGGAPGDTTPAAAAPRSRR